LKRTGSKHKKSLELPNVSVIICLHNEEKNIAQLVKHVSNQDYPDQKHEILFVDDRSDDRTYQLLKEHTLDINTARIIKIDSTEDGFAPKKYAITMAVAQAKGDILLFTDADGRPGSGWISSMISCFTPETGMVLGYAPYITSNRFKNMISRILALEYLSHAAVSAASSGLHYPVTCVGTNLAYRKSVFKQLDGFGKFKNIHTGDDDLFLQRVREETDWSIRYMTDGKSHVFNAPPDTLAQFYNQRLRYASKGFLYPIKINLSLMFFYIYNLLFAINLVVLIFQPSLYYLYLISLSVKFAVDNLFMRKAARILYDQRHVGLIPFALLLHIPYVIYFGLAAQLQSFVWADRKG
jgi:cellulose synthase/poly-beta-1,6-N-acetylglucosamine synthase-like glycosyltransferase